MNVYQIHFDSSDKADRAFNTFYFEPENIYENRAGQLFLAGSAKDSAKEDGSFISMLARVVREEFYSVEAKRGRTALRKTLKAANQFLQKIAESGSVEWLSDFNFAILNIVPKKSGSEDEPAERLLNFTKTGSIKIILLRAGEVINLGQKIKEEGIDPYPVKVFHHIASGKIQEGDRILILNEGFYERLLEKGTLRAIASISFLSQKKISRVFASLGQDLWGFCLLIDIVSYGSAGRIELFFRERKDHRFIKKLMAIIAKLRPLPIHIKLPAFHGLSAHSKIFTIFKLKKKGLVSKNLALILFLLALLIAGRFATQREKGQDQGPFPNPIEPNQENTQSADLEIFFEWEEKEFFPQRLVISGSDLLCFPPNETRVFRITPDASSSAFETDFHLKDAVSLESGTVVFLTQENELVLMEQESMGSPFSLEKLDDEFQLTHMSSFSSSIYFWDERLGQVARYSRSEPGAAWPSPYDWLKKPNTLKEMNAFSMAVGRSIWFLSSDSVAQYYKGELVKELSIYIFPEIKPTAQIFTSKDTPYLYIIDPSNERIILLDKESGEITAQYQGDKFRSLKHLVLSEQGVIYILDELRIYKILF